MVTVLSRSGPVADGRGPARWRIDRETLLLRLGSIVGLLVVWAIGSLWIGADIIPGPVAVARRAREVVLHEQFVLNLAVTLTRVLIGLAVSLALAVVLGIGMGLSRAVEQFFDGLVLAGRTMPGLAWALLALMVIGVSGQAPILAVVLSVTPLLTLQIWEGTKDLDGELFEMAKVFGVGRTRQLREVVVPAVLPGIVGGAKLGLALSWKVTVLAELFGVTSGVGYEINRNFQIFSLDGVLAWAILFALVMAVIEYGVIGPVHRRLTRWRGPTGRRDVLGAPVPGDTEMVAAT